MGRWSRCAMLVALLSVGASCGAATGTDPNALTGDPDAGGASESGTTRNPPPTSYIDPFAGAPAYSTPQPADTTHHPGESCMQQGCHGGDAPSFLIGGTVYTDYKGAQPAVGIEIRIVDARGHAASCYSTSNGNFYIHSGAGGVSFPAVVGARDETTTRPMVTALSTAGMGSCAQASCHVSPPAGYYPIHVP